MKEYKYLRDAWDRAVAEKSSLINMPIKAVPHFAKWRKKRQEHLLVMTLSASLHVIKVHVVFKGTADRCLAHSRDIFYCAIKDNASGIIVAHNHPGMSLTFSQGDLNSYTRLEESGKILGINVFDYMVISSHGYNSMVDGKVYNE